MSEINADRLLEDLRALSAIGRQPNGGLDRLAWSNADLAGRRWFAERIRESGLEPRVDAALNVFGHMPGAAGPFVLTGSHLDGVPNGGRLDGAYGAWRRSRCCARWPNLAILSRAGSKSSGSPTKRACARSDARGSAAPSFDESFR